MEFNAMTLEVTDYQCVRVRKDEGVPALLGRVGFQRYDIGSHGLSVCAGTQCCERTRSFTLCGQQVEWLCGYADRAASPPFSTVVDPITLVVVHAIFVADGATDLHRSRSYWIQFTPWFTIRHFAR